MGTATSKLNLLVCHGVYCTGKPMMHMMDYIPMVNIMPFGSCVVLQGAPCVPVTVPWMIPNMTFYLTGHIPAITTKSFCVCLLGGMISPNDSGQGVIQVKLNGPVERAGVKSNNKASSEDSDDGLTYDEKSGKLEKTSEIKVQDIINQYNKKAKRSIKLISSYTSDTSPYDILKNELHNNCNVEYPPYSFSAHHIVPIGMKSKECENSRKILKKYNIDLNSAANGVFLPNKDTGGLDNEALHKGGHSNDYYKIVDKKLKKMDKFIEKNNLNDKAYIYIYM